MAGQDKRIRDLPPMELGDIANSDVLPIVDLSAFETKKVAFNDLKTKIVEDSAPLNSPALTGSPTAPTVTPTNDSTNKIATTKFVQDALASVTVEDATTLVKGKIRLSGDLSGTADSPTVPALADKAPLDSPSFTGIPTAPTVADTGDNSTKIATTAFVQSIASGGSADVSDLVALSGVPANSTDLGTFTGTTIPDNTTVKGALQSLETSNEAKASTSDLAVHTSANSGVHGVTGDVVGTTDTQTLTNKTLTSPTISGGSLINASVVTPSQSDVKQGTFANLVTYASTATNGQLVFATDNKKMYQVIDGALSDVGGGGQTLETLMQLTADEPISDWNNFGGGFEISKVDPLFGDASYVLEMTDLKAATHKVIPVDIGFRGTTVALTLNYLMLDGAARVELLDQDNNLIDGAQFDIPAANGKEKFGVQVFIPSTVTGIRFKAESRATVTGGSFKFDNVQLSSDLLKSVDIEGDYHAEVLSTTAIISVSTDLSTLSVDLSRGNTTLFTKSSQGLTFLRDGDISITASAVTGNIRPGTEIYLNGVAVSTSQFTTSESIANTASWSFPVKKGDKITVHSEYFTTGSNRISIYAKARTKSIVAPVDQVTERSIAFKYANASEYTEATLANAPDGTYITFKSTGATYTQTTGIERPTQTDADMSVNGILATATSRGANSSSDTPSKFMIKLPKGMVADFIAYNLGKTKSSALLNMVIYGAGGEYQMGFTALGLDSATGILTIDFKAVASSNTAHNGIFFSDRTNAASCYITFTASKLAQGVAIPTPARYMVKTYQSGTSWYEIYNDGWVRQSQLFTRPLWGIGGVTYLVPMRDTDYTTLIGWRGLSGDTANINAASGGVVAGSESTTGVQVYAGITGKHIYTEGYGDSATVKSHGAKPNY